MLIRVHVAVAKNSIPYYEWMRQNYVTLASDNVKLEFWAYSMEGDLKLNADNFIVCPNGRGSTGHAVAMTVALKQPVTEDVKILADSDTAFLMKNWDAWLVSAIKQRGYQIVGPTGRRIGARDAPDVKQQSYKGKPTLTWCALSSDVDFSSLDIMPCKTQNIPVDSAEKSMLWELPIGKELLRDVGWKLPQFLHDNNVSYLALDNLQPSDVQSIAIKDATDYSEEFQDNGLPVLAHQRGSNYHQFRTTRESRSFYDAVEKYLARQ